MTKKRIMLTGIAALACVSMVALAAINPTEPEAYYRTNAETKSQLFDSALANTYWVGTQVYTEKIIARTSNPDNDIHAKVEGCKEFGGGRFCLCDERMIGRTASFMIGVNNLQSFSFNFHCNVSDILASDPTRLGYTATAKFYGEEFSFDYPDSEKWSPVLFTESFESKSIVKNQGYQLNWTKSDQ